MPGSPFRAVLAWVRELTHVSPGLDRPCMSYGCSACARSVPHSSDIPESPSSFCRGQDKAEDALTVLHYRAWFFSLFLLCTLQNHLLLEGREVVPSPESTGHHHLAEGSQLPGSPSLLGPAPALLHPPPNIPLLLRAAPASCSPCPCLASPREMQPFTFPASLHPQGTRAAWQHACPDGLIQFDFLRCIYSSFLESLFHWRLPE